MIRTSKPWAPHLRFPAGAGVLQARLGLSSSEAVYGYNSSVGMEYVVFLALLLYLLPWLVAAGYEHRRESWILALVVGLGWTGVGWLAALVWAWSGRPRPAPVLHVAGRPPPIEPPSRWRLSLRGVAVGLAATCGVAFVAWQLSLPPDRVPISGTASLLAANVPVHRGPGVGWPSVGSLESPCTLHLLESVGEWRRIWRTQGCAGSMSGNAGWLPASQLRIGEP